MLKHAASSSQNEVTRCFTAFDRGKIIVSGELEHVVTYSKMKLSRDSAVEILIFDDATGEHIDVDLGGPVGQILKHLSEFDPNRPCGVLPSKPKGQGRPKLGVMAREVTLLPRHWEWLNHQKGGASATLRRLVEEARRTSAGKDKTLRAQESCYRFMAAVAGNQPDFEEAARSLFASNKVRFKKAMAKWPADIREYAGKLSDNAFTNA